MARYAQALVILAAVGCQSKESPRANLVGRSPGPIILNSDKVFVRFGFLSVNRTPPRKFRLLIRLSLSSITESVRMPEGLDVQSVVWLPLSYMTGGARGSYIRISALSSDCPSKMRVSIGETGIVTVHQDAVMDGVAFYSNGSGSLDERGTQPERPHYLLSRPMKIELIAEGSWVREVPKAFFEEQRSRGKDRWVIFANVG